MPKKADARRAKAKELYEAEGLSLAEIAKELDISAGTIRGWKSKDKKNGLEWSAPKRQKPKREKRSKRSNKPQPNKKNETSIKPGEQKALKHGLYAKHLPPWVNDILETIDPEADELEKLKSVIEVQYALYIGAIGRVDIEEGGLRVLNETASKLGTLITQYKTLKARVGETVEDDGFIEALERSASIIWEERENEEP